MARPHLYCRYVPLRLAKRRLNATFSLRHQPKRERLLFPKPAVRVSALGKLRQAASGQKQTLEFLLGIT